MSLRNMYNLKYEKSCGTDEVIALVMQYNMTDADAAKVDVNVKADYSDTSDDSKNRISQD